MNWPSILTLDHVRDVLGPALPRWLKGKTGIPTADAADRLRGMQHEFEQANVRLGVIGESGSGKSSLINAMVGRHVAPVGALIETTQGPQEVPVDGLTLVDLPGCGTPNWPKDSYIHRLELLESYDGFILVTAHRLKECDALLFQELASKAKKPFFVVRSHFDQAVARHSVQEARAVITGHIRQQLASDPQLPVYMVSSVTQEHYDLEQLILDIRNALPEWKQVRFIMAAHAYGPATLARKREAAERIAAVYAGLAAANALNPIPGLDISVDIGLLTTMSRYIISTYGLRQDQIDALTGQARRRTWIYKAMHEVADRFTPYLTEKFVVSALKRVGTKTILRNSSKWVPLVGTVISAGIGYRVASQFGDQLINDCEVAARKVGDIFEQSLPPEEELVTFQEE
ncbi:MAG: 50S ribosome-binding GTPase [Gemmataceae bacterium]|nr:50S ribosome-binding GTPase [Gemmataceae bacterium]